MVVTAEADAGEKLDRRLVKEFLKNRSPAAFHALYSRHAELIYRFALRVSGGCRNVADELTQEAWVRAIERLEGFRWNSALRTWLIGIVLNCRRERTRREKREGLRLVQGPEALGRPSRPRPAWDTVDLENALRQLAPRYREVLLLHDVEGYTHAEIGGLLGIEEGTSKSQLSRARRALRRHLGPQEVHRGRNSD